MQSPLNRFREIISALRENRKNLQPIHSPGISNEDAEQQTVDSPSDEGNGDVDEEKGSHQDAIENSPEELKIGEVNK